MSKHMNPDRQLGIGAMLSVFGGVGIALIPLTSIMQVNRPWSFLSGFLLGVCAGSGAALCVWGLLKRRNEEAPGL